MEKLIITAAICGAEVTKQQNPAVPYTVAEMVREARSAYDAGASIIHVHVRWADEGEDEDIEYLDEEDIEDFEELDDFEYDEEV